MSLTTTAKNVKIGFVVSVIGIILYLLTTTLFIPMTKNAYLAIFPPKEEPATIYGILDPIRFESQQILNTDPPKYTLFTSNGKLPTNLPDKLKIYKYAKPTFSYSAGKKAMETAEILGFTKDDLTTNLKGNEYKWSNFQTKTNLTIEINSGKLVLETAKNSFTHTHNHEKSILSEETAKIRAKEVLYNINRFSDSLYLEGTQSVDLGKIENGKIKRASYVGEAEIGYVNFFREIEKYPIVGPTYKQGLIRLYVGDKETEEITDHPYIYYNVCEIQTQSKATYPLISAKVAWTEIINNNGIISSIKSGLQNPFENYKPIKITEILINNISLAYYDDTQKQPYLQPIYVFEGNYIGPNNDKGSIAIYYPAITNEYIKKVNSDTENKD